MHFEGALLREWEAITLRPGDQGDARTGAARGETCKRTGEQRSHVLAILLAKEVNEWGHLATAVAGRATELGWQLAELTGAQPSCLPCHPRPGGVRSFASGLTVCRT